MQVFMYHAAGCVDESARERVRESERERERERARAREREKERKKDDTHSGACLCRFCVQCIDILCCVRVCVCVCIRRGGGVERTQSYV